jgi:quercetin dioxygenase-like cupin family protein
MTVRTGRTGVWTIAALVAAVGIAGAQQPTFKRTELQRGDLSASGREAITAVVDFPVGVASGKHTHNGEEIGYILEGTVTVEVDGKPPMVLKPGGVFLIPSGTVHNARNTDAGASKLLANFIVEKGKPLATPAP